MTNFWKFFLPVFYATIFVSITQAQNWMIQNSGTAQHLWDVQFVNDDVGFACGDSGTLLKTNNGGNNWISIPTGTTESLIKIHFPGASVGYIGIQNSVGMLKTTDGGDTWNQLSLNLPGSFGGGIWFVNDTTGFYAFGNNQYSNPRILRTYDGGQTWDTVYNNPTGWLSYLFFADEMNGYASGSGGTVLITNDGGNSWIQSLNGTNMWMSGIFFFE